MPSSAVQTCADRKSTRLNSSHGSISYAVFCLKKKTQLIQHTTFAASSSPSRRATPSPRAPPRRSRERLDGRLGSPCHPLCWILFFFFNDTATTEIYTLSLHDALPI